MIKKYEKIENYFISELDKSELGYRIENGKGKVILVAPHSVSQLREGRIKVGEYRTGLIVKELRKFTNCPIMYKTKNLNDDANYDSNCKFKKGLSKYIKENDIKSIIHFHISADTREHDIDIGTGKGKNLIGREDLLKLMINKLKETYEDVRVDDIFAALGNNNISAVGRELNIPSFQIEVTWRNISTYEKTEILINKFTEIIEELEKII